MLAALFRQELEALLGAFFRPLSRYIQRVVLGLVLLSLALLGLATAFVLGIIALYLGLSSVVGATQAVLIVGAAALVVGAIFFVMALYRLRPPTR